MKIRSVQTTLLALLLFILHAQGQHIIPRGPVTGKFEVGNKKKYQLDLEQWHNGKLNNSARALCELTTIKDSGAYYQVVRWLSLVQITGKDTLSRDSVAVKVKPYRIALDSAGKLEIPKIDVPEMTQPIQDFTTFFVAISPQLGILNINRVGEVYQVPNIIKGDLASGNFILKGEDCFRVKLKYESLINNIVTIITSFEPPQENCLNHYLPEMKTPVIDGMLNNIQMVMSSNDKFNIQYGVEEFTIETQVSRFTGALLAASMRNSLSFKMKINCNAIYQDCSFDMPFKILRKLNVKMLD